MSPSKRLGAAPRANAGNRTEVVPNEAPFTIAKPKPEGDFAALYLARRYRLPLPMARTVAALANLGRAML